MSSPFEEIKVALQNDDHAQAAQKALEFMESVNNVPLTIAVTGETGSGKSTFINALRGLKNSDDGAAPTGIVETTMEATEYLHPNYPNVKLWDLPGIGTTKFTADQYLQKVGFEKYDFFFIISDTRFRDNDAKLAQEIQKMEKKFYFVRSKVDQNMADEIKSQTKFNEDETLTLIRDNCTQGLCQLEIESPKVFLVSCFDLHLYDFGALCEILEKELPEHKRDALLHALPCVTLEVINKKKELLCAKIKWFALASAAGAAVPVPGISVPVDIGIIVTFGKLCQASFGLTEKAFQKPDVLKPLNNFREELKSQLAGVKITKDVIVRVLASSAVWTTAAVAEEGSKLVPLLGIPVAMTLSFVTTYQTLHLIVDKMSKDAQKVSSQLWSKTQY